MLINKWFGNIKIGQWLFGIYAVITTFTITQGLSWPSLAFPMILKGETGFVLTEEQLSWVVTVPYIGNVISPLIAGYSMDRIGRKTTLFIFNILIVISWIIVAVCTDPISIYIARFIVGAWEGVTLTVLPAYIAEVMDPSIRGAMGVVFGYMLYTAAFYESLVGTGSYLLLNVLSAIPPVIALFAFILIPESPYYYLMHNKIDKARKSLQFLRNCSEEDLTKIKEGITKQLQKKSSFIDIFKSSANRKAFITVQILAIVQRSAGASVLFAYLTITFPSSFVTPTQLFTILCLVWLISSFASSFVVDKLPRRFLLFTSCVGCFLTMMGISIWFYLKLEKLTGKETNWIPNVLLIINGVFYSFGIVSIPNLIQGEIFPMHIKGKASAVSGVTFAVVSGIVVKIYHPLAVNVGVYANFLIPTVSCLIGAIFTLTYMIETKGKTLEEIQDILQNKKSKVHQSQEVET